MPRREDEYWAGIKEPGGRGLCPFCGSSDIYLFFGGEAGKLFLSFEMPIRITPVVERMSLKGLQS